MSVNYTKMANIAKLKVNVLNGATIANTNEHNHAPVVGKAEVLHVRVSNKQFICIQFSFYIQPVNPYKRSISLVW